MKRIGAFAAKTHLSQLLEKVEDGEHFVITRHGKDIAKLIPADHVASPDAKAAIERWRRIRPKVRLRGLNVRDLINEGRR